MMKIVRLKLFLIPLSVLTGACESVKTIQCATGEKHLINKHHNNYFFQTGMNIDNIKTKLETIKLELPDLSIKIDSLQKLFDFYESKSENLLISSYREYTSNPCNIQSADKFTYTLNILNLDNSVLLDVKDNLNITSIRMNGLEFFFQQASSITYKDKFTDNCLESKDFEDNYVEDEIRTEQSFTSNLKSWLALNQIKFRESSTPEGKKSICTPYMLLDVPNYSKSNGALALLITWPYNFNNKSYFHIQSVYGRKYVQFGDIEPAGREITQYLNSYIFKLKELLKQ